MEVCARTDPDLPSFMTFPALGENPICQINAISTDISKILDHEVNWRRCPHGSVTASDGMTHIGVAGPMPREQ